MSKMKILLLTIDVWNDSTNGNNCYTNWFENFDAEFANIYLGPGVPDNNICTKYFQVSDKMMVRSFWGPKAGRIFEMDVSVKKQGINTTSQTVEEYDANLYKQIKKYASEPLRLVYDILWTYGRYDFKAMQAFIDEFNPDIIFCPHLFSIKSRRIERIIHSMTDVPMVAFTGDVEASIKAISYNPLFWIRRLYLASLYGKHVKIFKQYFTFSASQCKDIQAKYGVPAEPLYKCVDLGGFQPKKPNKVIRMIYAGRLYCNRWKSISAIGDALKELNKDVLKAEIYVYSQDHLTKEQEIALSEYKYIHFMGVTNPANLPKIYKEADIALHVESFDKKNMYATMHSFSTKIIDLMASTCAIMAICWDQNNGWNYLKNEDAAICLSDYSQILPKLREITENPRILVDYAYKAYDCGIRNHKREKIQKQLRDKFNKIVYEQYN